MSGKVRAIGLVAVVLLLAGGLALALQSRGGGAEAVPASAAAATGGDAATAAHERTGDRARPLVTVYKSPTCGCCADWVEHLRHDGFRVETIDGDVEVAQAKRRLGIQPEHVSCHTAIVDGYAIEGHVPADVIRRLLRERPEGVAGLAVPGMPMGSPGMEGPRKDAYDVLAFDRNGDARVYESR